MTLLHEVRDALHRGPAHPDYPWHELIARLDRLIAGMGKEPKRYIMVTVTPPDNEPPYGDMRERPNGPYVLAEAYDTLAVRLADDGRARYLDLAAASDNERERDALRKDAERYRWIRQEHHNFDVSSCDSDDPDTPWYRTLGEGLDAAIDAAMKERP